MVYLKSVRRSWEYAVRVPILWRKSPNLFSAEKVPFFPLQRFLLDANVVILLSLSVTSFWYCTIKGGGHLSILQAAHTYPPESMRRKMMEEILMIEGRVRIVYLRTCTFFWTHLDIVRDDIIDLIEHIRSICLYLGEISRKRVIVSFAAYLHIGVYTISKFCYFCSLLGSEWNSGIFYGFWGISDSSIKSSATDTSCARLICRKPDGCIPTLLDIFKFLGFFFWSYFFFISTSFLRIFIEKYLESSKGTWKIESLFWRWCCIVRHDFTSESAFRYWLHDFYMFIQESFDWYIFPTAESICASRDHLYFNTKYRGTRHIMKEVPSTCKICYRSSTCWSGCSRNRSWTRSISTTYSSPTTSTCDDSCEISKKCIVDDTTDGSDGGSFTTTPSKEGLEVCCDSTRVGGWSWRYTSAYSWRIDRRSVYIRICCDICKWKEGGDSFTRNKIFKSFSCSIGRSLVFQILWKNQSVYLFYISNNIIFWIILVSIHIESKIGYTYPSISFFLSIFLKILVFICDALCEIYKCVSTDGISCILICFHILYDFLSKSFIIPIFYGIKCSACRRNIIKQQFCCYAFFPKLIEHRIFLEALIHCFLVNLETPFIDLCVKIKSWIFSKKSFLRVYKKRKKRQCNKKKIQDVFLHVSIVYEIEKKSKICTLGKILIMVVIQLK